MRRKITNSCMIVGCILLLGSVAPPPVLAQSLPETVAYLFSGGMVDPKGMKIVDDSTVQVPSYFAAMHVMPVMTIKITDKQSCTVRASQTDGRGPGEIELYFNKVIPEQTRERPAGMFPMRLVDMHGDEPIMCYIIAGLKSNCQRTWDTNVNENNLTKYYAAMKHLYANYCRPSKP